MLCEDIQLIFPIRKLNNLDLVQPQKTKVSRECDLTLKLMRWICPWVQEWKNTQLKLFLEMQSIFSFFKCQIMVLKNKNSRQGKNLLFQEILRRNGEGLSSTGNSVRKTNRCRQSYWRLEKAILSNTQGEILPWLQSKLFMANKLSWTAMKANKNLTMMWS